MLSVYWGQVCVNNSELQFHLTHTAAWQRGCPPLVYMKNYSQKRSSPEEGNELQILQARSRPRHCLAPELFSLCVVYTSLSPGQVKLSFPMHPSPLLSELQVSDRATA